MPTSSSPGEDILYAIIHNIGPIIIILIAILGSIGRAMKSGSRPPSGLPKVTSTPPMAPPTTIPRPTTLPQPTAPAPPRPVGATPQAPPRPVAQPKFRPQDSPGARQTRAGGTSSDQLAQERADIERFVKEEKEMEAAEPAALGVALTSPAAQAPGQSQLLASDGPVSGPSGNLVRAIMLAQALGPPRSRSGRR